MARESGLVDLDLTFTGSGHLYATHGIHAFAARCPPPLVDWAINSYSNRGDVILDPMAGSGTALVEACLLGRRALGADIDPLARLIARVKATPVNLDGYDKTVDELAEIMHASNVDDTWRPDLPNWERWFRPDVASDLARLREVIPLAGAEPQIRDLLWVAFSSLIVARTSVANARDLVHSRHHYRKWAVNPDVPGRFLRRLHQIRSMMASYADRLHVNGVAEPEVDIVANDARSLALDDASVDLVFTSPPYCSALDYTRAHMFAVAWMADVLGTTVTAYRQLGRAYVGSERAPLADVRAGQGGLPPSSGIDTVDGIVTALAHTPKRAWIVHRYFRDMALVLAEAQRVVRPGGHLVVVVCPSNIRAVPIPTHRVLVELVSPSLSLVEMRERTIHDHRRVMPYLEASFGPRMRTEYVVVLRHD